LMKVYNRTDFMKLPNDVIFSKGKKWYFDGLGIKGDTIGSDFIYTDLISICSHNMDQLDERFTSMLEHGLSYPINDVDGRDGFFDSEDLFLVYEDSDLDRMIDLFQKAKGKI